MKLRSALSLRFTAWTLLAATLAPSLAFAEGDPSVPISESQDRTLEDLIQQGIRLRKAGNDEAALQVFHDAERRNPDSVRVLLNIAGAAAAVGKWIECDAYFRKVSSHRDDPYYQRHRAAITAIENTLARKVGRFTASGTPLGAEIRLNGELIGNLNMAEPQTVEAGTYVLEVSQPGYYRVRRQITIQAGILARESIDLNELPPAAASAPASAQAGGDVSSPLVQMESPSSAPIQPERAPARQVEPTSSGRWFTWTLAGLGLAAAATGGVAFAIREQHAKRWNDDNRCLPTTGKTREETCGDERKSAETAERVAIVGGAAAVVLGTGALIHWLSTRSSTSSSASGSASDSLARSTTCGVGLLSIGCQGSF
ncbi:MAG TPA: PEGA domain-containing protein [Polyangiaceae bacterium]|nr:PEGA domain-containing protein [Polyangiaceae bacterium]